MQALYQMELAGQGVETVVREFPDHRFDADMEGEPLAEADEDCFAEIVRGVVGEPAGHRRRPSRRGWPPAGGWSGWTPPLRALLRAGAWELREQPDVPREIVIDEYVELAKAFFDEAEAKFVNAALDGVARDARRSEVDVADEFETIARLFRAAGAPGMGRGA